MDPGVIFLFVVGGCGLVGAAGGVLLSPPRQRVGGAVTGALAGLVLGGMVTFTLTPGTGVADTPRAYHAASR